MNGNSIQHLSTVLQWIKDEKHFGIVRPGDGEFYVISDITITVSDNWTYTSGGILKNDLLTSLKMKNFLLFLRKKVISKKLKKKLLTHNF